MASLDAVVDRDIQLTNGAWAEPYDAYAQITARCSSKHHHAYALFVQVAGDRVEQARYSHGSTKVQFETAPREVRTAVELFCTFAAGKPLAQVAGAGLPEIAAAHGVPGLDASSFDEPPASDDAMVRLRRDLGEPVFCLLVGGAVPFILFNWAVVNLQIKRTIARVLGTGPRDKVRFRDLRDMYALLEALGNQPVLNRSGRSLELGVRSLHLTSVDESSLRSAYQRDTYSMFLADARRRGFLDHFEVTSLTTAPDEGTPL